jgi:acyl-coenzyme A thioesterase PaaI-like protein
MTTTARQCTSFSRRLEHKAQAILVYCFCRPIEGVSITMSDPATGARLNRWWQRLAMLPGGKWLFSHLLGRIVPYTGTIGAQVQILQPGYAQILMKSRHRVRNHLHSTHAIALANLGEMASGLALLIGLPDGVRGIVTSLHIEYYKKARGDLIAQSHCEIPPVLGETDYRVYADIRDMQGDTVARTTVCWRLGLTK